MMQPSSASGVTNGSNINDFVPLPTGQPADIVPFAVHSCIIGRAADNPNPGRKIVNMKRLFVIAGLLFILGVGVAPFAGAVDYPPTTASTSSTTTTIPETTTTNPLPKTGGNSTEGAILGGGLMALGGIVLASAFMRRKT